jgi:hypothetical protein
MAEPPNPRRRKTRTRQHVIADLGVNFVERVILLAGYTAERFRYDYGLDLMMKTYNPIGEVESGHVALQVKATEHLATHADGATFPVRIETADLKAWLFESFLVVLVIYDAVGERAFWVDIQEYAHTNDIDEEPGGQTATIRIPVANVFDVSAVGQFRDRKERLGESGGPTGQGPAPDAPAT